MHFKKILWSLTRTFHVFCMKCLQGFVAGFIMSIDSSQIKDIRVVWARRQAGGNKKCMQKLLEKPLWKRPLGNPRCK